MFTKHTYIRFRETGIYLFLIGSMLFISDTEFAGFPIYSLLLLIAAVWFLLIKIFFCKRERLSFVQIRHLTDVLPIAVIIIEILGIIMKLFRNPNEGAIDFAGNAEVIALMLLYVSFSTGMEFRLIYLDLILYGGLLIIGLFIYICLTGEPANGFAGIMAADSGAIASYLMLFCMISVYSYCVSKEKMRSYFYLATSLIGLFALLVNQNILSFWLMTVYFIAIPIMLRPTAALVKKDMQIFFIYGLMMSNMSLLTEYTDVILKETAYSLEHSVYLDLILAIGGLFFFYYWDRIPEGIDINRLVMRRMRRGYLFLIKIIVVIFSGIVISADKWALLGENVSSAAIKGFALPLVESIRKSESGIYACFRDGGIAGAAFCVFFLLLLFGRSYRNYGFDKPVTGILILISALFIVQFLFWKPALHTTAIYFMLFLFAVFNKEESVKVRSIKVRGETLRKQNEQIKKGAWS